MLEKFVTLPIANGLLARRLREPAYAHLRGETLDGPQYEELTNLASKYYTVVDVLLLGSVGFMMGRLGFYLIGIPMTGKGLPGCAALLLASLLGLSLV